MGHHKHHDELQDLRETVARVRELEQAWLSEELINRPTIYASVGAFLRTALTGK